MAVEPPDEPPRVPEPGNADEPIAALFRRHYHAVRSYASFLVEAGDVDDVVAETFIVAVRRSREIPAGSERAWLLGVARKQAASHRRNERRRLELTDDLAATRPADTTPFAGGRLSIEERHVLAQTIAALNDSEREILVLSAWHGLNGNDLAVSLGVTPNAAAVRLHRARERFAAAHRARNDERTPR